MISQILVLVMTYLAKADCRDFWLGPRLRCVRARSRSLCLSRRRNNTQRAPCRRFNKPGSAQGAC